MGRGSRAELERLVQDLDRKHPEWTSRQIETELELLAPVAYGGWKDDTPVLRARHRQVQRWRTGDRGAPHPPASRLPYQYLWPVGEQQRKVIEPGFAARPTRLHASHRVFLHNCSEETLREVRVELGGREVAYEPALAPGKCMEVHWVRNDAIRAATFRCTGHEPIRHVLAAEFAYSRGTRRACLEGELTMDATDGWTAFASRGGPSKEVE